MNDTVQGAADEDRIGNGRMAGTGAAGGPDGRAVRPRKAADPKADKAFRTISEVAELIGAPSHVIRFWETRFTQVKPVKRAGGRRYFRPADIELLAGIRKLLHEDGLAIRGVQKILREQGVKSIAIPLADLEARLAAGEVPPPKGTTATVSDSDETDTAAEAGATQRQNTEPQETGARQARLSFPELESEDGDIDADLIEDSPPAYSAPSLPRRLMAGDPPDEVPATIEEARPNAGALLRRASPGARAALSRQDGQRLGRLLLRLASLRSRR